MGRAEAESGFCDAPCTGLGHCQRDAEISDQRFSAFTEQDVARLNVSVDYSVFVRVAEPVNPDETRGGNN